MLSHSSLEFIEPEKLPLIEGKEEVMFKNKLESIRDFIDRLDNDP